MKKTISYDLCIEDSNISKYFEISLKKSIIQLLSELNINDLLKIVNLQSRITNVFVPMINIECSINVPEDDKYLNEHLYGKPVRIKQLDKMLIWNKIDAIRIINDFKIREIILEEISIEDYLNYYKKIY